MYTSERKKEMASVERPRRKNLKEGALGIMSHIGVGAVVAAATVCMGCCSSVTTDNDNSAVLLGGEAVGRLAADRVGELVDCDARGGVPVKLVV